MKRHYVVTVTCRRRWWHRRSIHTLSGEIVVSPDHTDREIFNRVCEAAVEIHSLPPGSTGVLFYRLEPAPCATLGS